MATQARALASRGIRTMSGALAHQRPARPIASRTAAGKWGAADTLSPHSPAAILPARVSATGPFAPAGPRRFAATTTAAPIAEERPADPETWTADQVQAWFEDHKEGKWNKYAGNFTRLNGKNMSALSEEDFHAFADDPLYGAVIYNDWRTELHAADEALVERDASVVAAQLSAATVSNLKAHAQQAAEGLPEQWQLNLNAVERMAWSMLPLVNREDELRLTAAALVGSQYEMADSMARGHNEQPENLTLVVCGHLFGTGKTTFGRPLAATLEAAIGRPVRRVLVERGYTTLEDLNARIVRGAGLGSLRSATAPRSRESSMSNADFEFTLRAGLARDDSYVLVHLDEFIVSVLPETMFSSPDLSPIDRLHDIWNSYLMMLQRLPRVFLYVTGKSLLFSEIGYAYMRSPTRVHNVMLAPLDGGHLLTSLRRLHVDGDGDGVRALGLESDADAVAFAEALARVSGGIPRYAQLLIANAMAQRRKAPPDACPTSLELVEPGGQSFEEVANDFRVTRAVKLGLADADDTTVHDLLLLAALTAKDGPVFRLGGLGSGQRMRDAELSPKQASTLQRASQFSLYYTEVTAGLRFTASPLVRRALQNWWPSTGCPALLDTTWQSVELGTAYAILLDEMASWFRGHGECRLPVLRRALGLSPAPALQRKEPEDLLGDVDSAVTARGLPVVGDLPKVVGPGQGAALTRLQEGGEGLVRREDAEAHFAGTSPYRNVVVAKELATVFLEAAVAQAPSAAFRVFMSAERSHAPNVIAIVDTPKGRALVGCAVKSRDKGKVLSATDAVQEVTKFVDIAEHLNVSVFPGGAHLVVIVGGAGAKEQPNTFEKQPKKKFSPLLQNALGRAEKAGVRVMMLPYYDAVELFEAVPAVVAGVDGGAAMLEQLRHSSE